MRRTIAAVATVGGIVMAGCAPQSQPPPTHVGEEGDTHAATARDVRDPTPNAAPPRPLGGEAATRDAIEPSSAPGMPVEPQQPPTGASPTSGAPSDDAEDFYFYRYRWPDDRRDVGWATTTTLPASVAAQAVAAARVWNGLAGSLRFSDAPEAVADFDPVGCGEAQRGTNGLHWASLDGPGDAVAITHTCLIADRGEAVSFQMVLDRDETWHTTAPPIDPGAYDVLGVLIHEFGHATFWDGHYPDHDPACSPATLVMCPLLERGSDAWRHPAPLDQHIYHLAYPER